MWQQYEPTLRQAFPEMQVRHSEHKGHISALGKELALAGHKHIVAVGGDGTHHELINGLFEALGPEQLNQVVYCLLPLGSGNDWIRTHRIPRQLDAWIANYQSGKTNRQNLGSLHYCLPDGSPAHCVFTNVAGMAYDAYVVQRSNTSRFKNRLLYPLMTLLYLKDYTPPLLRLSYDGAVSEMTFHTINVGICRYSGGGMRLVPQADPAGDRFALTYAPALSILKILAHGWRFYTATIGSVPGVVCTHANSIEIEAVADDRELMIEADGELLGYGPLRFELLKNVLNYVG